MKTLNVAAAALALALAGVACFNTYNTNTAGQTQGGGSDPTTPDVPVQGAVTAVAVSKFGEDCPSGVSSTDNPLTVRVSCTARVTCTPKCGEHDCVPSEHGSQPDFFGVTSGIQYVQVGQEDNLFNLQLRALGPGDVDLSCKVKGITSATRTLTVVN